MPSTSSPPPPAYDDSEQNVSPPGVSPLGVEHGLRDSAPENHLQMLQIQIDELRRERDDRLKLEAERDRRTQEERERAQAVVDERIRQSVIENGAREQAAAELEAGYEESISHFECCIPLGRREVSKSCMGENTLSHVDTWECFVNKRLDRFGVAVFTFVGLLTVVGWGLALVYSGIETQSQFQRYKDHSWKEIPVYSTEFNQTCLASSCIEQCIDALSANLPIVELCTDGVDCDVPKYRFAWVTLMIILCSLIQPACEIVNKLIAVYRHCKYY